MSHFTWKHYPSFANIFSKCGTMLKIVFPKELKMILCILVLNSWPVYIYVNPFCFFKVHLPVHFPWTHPNRSLFHFQAGPQWWCHTNKSDCSVAVAVVMLQDFRMKNTVGSIKFNGKKDNAQMSHSYCS